MTNTFWKHHKLQCVTSSLALLYMMNLSFEVVFVQKLSAALGSAWRRQGVDLFLAVVADLSCSE